MRRVALALFSTITGLVILLDFKTHSTTAGTPPAAVGTARHRHRHRRRPAASDASSSAAHGGRADRPRRRPRPARSGTKTVTGDSVDTRWGPVQVQITVTNGKVTKANAVVYPAGTRATSRSTPTRSRR